VAEKREARYTYKGGKGYMPMETGKLFAIGWGVSQKTALLQVPGCRSRVAFAELMVDGQAGFCDMPDHRHVTLLALVGVTSLPLFCHDLRRIDVERVVRVRLLMQNRRFADWLLFSRSLCPLAEITKKTQSGF